jgi:predicted HicB family RNase H-like nuclease
MATPKVVLTIRVTEETHAVLKRASEREELSINQIVLRQLKPLIVKDAKEMKRAHA